MKKVLVVNCGSSSIKYRLIEMPDETLLAKGLLERIGESSSRLTQEIGDRKRAVDGCVADHEAGFELIVRTLLADERCPIDDLSEIAAVGHRVVHGGERFVASALLDDEVIGAIEEVQDLAPLHNRPNLAGIRAAQKRLPHVPHVAVFDTAFHQTMPEQAYLYALPSRLYSRHRIRRYGFHGTSHRYVVDKAARALGKRPDEVNLITCHLGNGCSMTAVERGKSIDTTMGMTPLEGLVMGTRCGDIDPAITFFLVEQAGLSLKEIDRIYNKESGLLGLSETSNDMRDIVDKAHAGDRHARLALNKFAYRVRKYIGAYFAVLGGADAILFGGGIGENAPEIRSRTCKDLAWAGVKLDNERNRHLAQNEMRISADDSPVEVWVIPVDEGAVIASETAKLLNGRQA